MDELQHQDQAPGPKSGIGTAQPSFWKRPPVIAVGTVLLAGLFYVALLYIAQSITHESTDDAFLAADIVSIAPKVAGQVQHVYVGDNQLVKAGDPLLDVDPRDFEVQLTQKKAARAAADANVELLKASIALLGAQVATAEAVARQTEAEAAADLAQADLANDDLKRAETLIQNRTISPKEFDSAKAAAKAAEATLKAGREKAASDQAKVAEARAQLEAGRKAWDRAEAQAKQSAADVDQARLNVSYSRLTAPCDGRVTRKAVEAGDYVQVGQKLMALVPGEVWVTANFKETQLRNIRTNQPVKIRVDSLGGRRLAGHVQSIQAGSGAAFSLLPPENAVGNYVKVVQRVPVKIVFDEPIATGHVLGPGMSVVPSVRVADSKVPDLAVALVAAALSGIAGAVWWRAANRKAG